jgi:integrase/recombinase XerD
MSRELVPVTRAVLVPDEGPTLCACVPRFLLWFEFVRHRSASTIQNYRFDLERGFLPFAASVGLVHPAAVRFHHLETYLGWLQHKKGVSARTANRHLHSLRAFWRYLLREGVTATNPPADVFLVPEPQRVPSRLSIAEQEWVLAHLAQDRTLMGRRDLALIATPLLTGLRCQEISWLRVKDIDLESRRLTVVSGKGDKGRELPIVPRLATILGEYLAEVRPQLVARPAGGVTFRREKRPGHGAGSWWLRSQVEGRRSRVYVTDQAAGLRQQPAGPAAELTNPWLFVRAGQQLRRRHAGQPLGGRGIFHLIRRVVGPLVGRPVHPHMLRHSFASRLRENGAPLELISECLGHAGIGTTMIYAKITTKKRHEDLARYLKGPEEAAQ